MLLFPADLPFDFEALAGTLTTTMTDFNFEVDTDVLSVEYLLFCL